MLQRFRMTLAAALAFTAIPAFASTLEIGPIRVQMIGEERTTTLNLRNSGTDPMTVQLRTVNWTQPNGGDDYSASNNLIASPPLVTIAPGESQVVRVVVEGLESRPNEKAYRLILDEIPLDRAGNGAGVRTALRALVPVFVTPSTESRPNLSWTAVRSGNTITLTARNDGTARERLVAMQVTAGGAPVAGTVEGYVLSGGTRIWSLTAPSGAASLNITGEGEFGAVNADVPIGG
jgi:fimbrial chaperone protein